MRQEDATTKQMGANANGIVPKQTSQLLKIESLACAELNEKKKQNPTFRRTVFPYIPSHRYQRRHSPYDILGGDHPQPLRLGRHGGMVAGRAHTREGCAKKPFGSGGMFFQIVCV